MAARPSGVTAGETVIAMRTLRAATLTIGLGGLLGCAATPPPPPPRPAPAPKPKRPAEPPTSGPEYQRNLIMMELRRTHPVLAATLDRDMTKLKETLQGKGKINEVRPDMRLGPPLREACRLGWRDGVIELRDHGAQCLGDAKCEKCVRDETRPAGYTTTP